MNIHITRVENTIQYFCHTAKFSRDEFGIAEIERAVNEAARDSSGENDFWITMTTPGMDSWEYLEPATV